ncbi:MAG: 50S ribosomal protein L25 [Leadbetterella sp.]
MKTTEIVGYNRANLGRQQAQELRGQGMVPGILYGGKEQVSFYAPAYLFRPLIFTPDAYEIKLTIDGKQYSAILQDKQFHPVNDMLIHVDLLEITPEKVITISIPIRLTGTAIGAKQGGKLVQTLRKLRVKGPAKSIPELVNLDVTELGLGKAIKVKAIDLPGLTILDSEANPVASVTIPRALRGQLKEGN